MNWILSSLTLSLLLGVSSIYGQGTPEASEERTSATVRPSVGEVWPRLIYLLDKDGQPTIPYVGLDWEKFNLQDGTLRARQGPPFLLSEVRLRAVADDRQVQIEVNLVVHCLTDGPQLVPIQLGNTHFRTQPKLDDGQIVRARFVESFEEYELLVQGRKDEDVRPCSLQWLLLCTASGTSPNCNCGYRGRRCPRSSWLFLKRN